MLQAEQLRHFKKYGEDLLKQLEEYDSAIKGQFFQEDKVLVDLRRCIENIREDAQSVVDCTSSPVKVAVMGEFKASKTTLLGSLLGYAGVLPDSEVAATGNVTHLRIVQVEEPQSTKFEFAVEYLNKAGSEQCLDFMLKQLLRKASDAKLPDSQLAELKSFSTKTTEIWQQVDRWCKNAESFGMKAIDELGVFVHSYIRYGDAVCGKRYPIDKESACSGLLLPANPADLFKLSFEQILPEEKHLPVFLQATFFLIQQIDVEVKVSKAIWDLSSLQGANKLILLDFPGLGAARSELRDQFLSHREMENVQTILLLTHGDRPGSAKDNEIIHLLRQQRHNQVIDDFILVGIGRFDELPNAEEHIDELLAEEHSLTEEIVLQNIPALKEAVGNARYATQKSNDRIILLSAFVALNYWRNELDSTIEVATPKVLERLNRFQQDANNLNRLKKWKKISDGLRQSQPESILRTWLDSFTKDGGISYLRRVIENHVTTHGLEQLYKDACTRMQNLCTNQERLKQILNSSSLRDLLVSETPNLRLLRQSIQELSVAHKDLKNYLEKNSLNLKVGIDKKNSVPLTQEVEEKATLDIFSWNQWRTLFSKLENGVINLDQVESLDGDEEDEGLFGALLENNQTTVFTKTDDFYSLFEETYKKLEEFTHNRIEQAIKDWLEELSTTPVSLKDTQSTVNIKQLRDTIEGCIQGTGVAKQAEALLNAASPTQWESTILKNVKKSIPLSIDPKDLFPLAYEERHKPGQMFDWSPLKKRTNPNPEKHLITVLQLRDAMIVSMSNKLVQLVSQANQKVNETLRKSILEKTIPALEITLENQLLLRRIATGEGQSASLTPDWLVILQEITNMNCPL